MWSHTDGVTPIFGALIAMVAAMKMQTRTMREPGRATQQPAMHRVFSRHIGPRAGKTVDQSEAGRVASSGHWDGVVRVAAFAARVATAYRRDRRMAIARLL